ncbi:MAG: hypothetical protein ACRCYU_16830, partial [Nocardioides sp.]
MKLALVTFLLGVASAVVPLVNIEIYLAALATQIGPAAAFGLALASGIGQTLGKVVWYVGAARFTESSWMRRKLTDARWQATRERWHARMAGAPWLSFGVVLLSGFAGIP